MGVYVQTKQLAMPLIFALVQHVVPLFCNGHWHNYFLQLGRWNEPELSLSFIDVYGTPSRGFLSIP